MQCLTLPALSPQYVAFFSAAATFGAKVENNSLVYQHWFVSPVSCTVAELQTCHSEQGSFSDPHIRVRQCWKRILKTPRGRDEVAFKVTEAIAFEPRLPQKYILQPYYVTDCLFDASPKNELEAILCDNTMLSWERKLSNKLEDMRAWQIASNVLDSSAVWNPTLICC